MNDLNCCVTFEFLRNNFVTKTESNGEVNLYSQEDNPLTGEKRFIITLYFCPYCGSKLGREAKVEEEGSDQ